MKNIFYLGLLMTLIFATWHFEEIGGLKKKAIKKKEASLFDPGELGDIRAIETKAARIEKGGDGKFRTARYHLDVDRERLQSFLSILGGVQIIRRLERNDWQGKLTDFFPPKKLQFKFEFENATLVYTIGNKLDFAQTFYMMIERGSDKQVLIVNDTAPSKMVQEKAIAYKSTEKYRRFVSMNFLKDDFFHDLRIFRDDFNRNSSRFETARISSFRTPKFFVNMKRHTTNPLALKFHIRYLQGTMIGDILPKFS